MGMLGPSWPQRRRGTCITYSVRADPAAAAGAGPRGGDGTRQAGVTGLLSAAVRTRAGEGQGAENMQSHMHASVIRCLALAQLGA